MQNARRLGLAVALVIVTLAPITACSSDSSTTPSAVPAGPKIVVEMDAPDYPRVRDLQGLSGAVVYGTFSRIVERTDEGSLIGQADLGAGLPMAVWCFHVDRTLWPGPVSDDVYIQRIDTDRIQSELLGDLSAGGTAVLFLRDVDKYDGATLYSVVGLDQGRLSVTDDGSLRANVPAGHPLAHAIASAGTVEALGAELASRSG